MAPRVLLCAAVAVALVFGTTHASVSRGGGPAVHVWKIHYTSYRGERRAAYVVVPAGWIRSDGPLPLVIAPHGRGIGGRQNAWLWGTLPADGPFAVVSPDGQGRRLARFSWGYRGQIDDLARMPEIVARALPQIDVDRSRVFAVGGSMGGQETLLLAALHPKLLAGAAVFDSVGDLALQYRNFPRLKCTKECDRSWGAPLGKVLQRLARTEVGGTPSGRPAAYAARSPISFVRQLAFSGVPIQFWWSRSDRVVVDQAKQSGLVFDRIRQLNPDAPVEAFVGHWQHSAEQRADSHLRYALEAFGLVTAFWVPRSEHLHFMPPPASWPWVQP